MRNTLAFLLAPLLVATVACGNNDNDEEVNAASDEGVAIGQQHAAETDADLGNDSIPTVIAKSGAIVIAIDDEEVALANFIVGVTNDRNVLDFANQMIADHTAHADSTRAFLANMSLAPVDSSVSLALRDEAAANLAELERSNSFDFTYMSLAVSTHSEADVIVGNLVDLAPTTDVAQFLDDTQLMIEQHRAEAESILRNL